MGGACSRKQGQQVNEEGGYRGVSRRYSRNGSSKWLGASFYRAAVDGKEGKATCPSLLELCTYEICEKIDQYGSFSMLPRDISQQIFNELVFSQRLIGTYLEAFRGCALQDIDLGEYPGVDDSWMEVISSQGSSLLSADLSGSDITDRALFHIKDCDNIQALNFNFCDQISDSGLDSISGLSNLTTLSFKRNNNITAEGMSALSGLVNLLKLDLERCPGIHGGLVHLRGLSKLEALNLNCCNCITDADMEPLSELTNLKELQVSSSKVTDYGVAFLKGLHKLALLNMERCPVTAACLDSLSAIMGLLYLNLSRCKLTGNGCDKFSSLKALKVLNLGFNDVSDAVMVHLKGLINLESLNLDSCRIRDDGLVHLAGGFFVNYLCLHFCSLVNIFACHHICPYSEVKTTTNHYLCRFSFIIELNICILHSCKRVGRDYYRIYL